MSEFQGAPTPLVNQIRVEHNGDVFIFKARSVMDRLRVATAAKTVRASVDPRGVGEAYGLDFDAVRLSDAIAIFQTLLLSGPGWVHVPGKDGLPVIDPDRWDDLKIDTLLEVLGKYETELARFRAGGLPDGSPAADPALHSGQGLQDHAV